MTADDHWVIPMAAVAVDLAVFTVQSGQLQILLVRRGVEPFRGDLALPGGFLASPEEDLDAAALRELTEETGLVFKGGHLEQLRTYGAPDRDPRGRVVTVCYLAFVPDLPIPVAGGDAQGAQWVPVGRVLRRRKSLAFDHVKIVKDALERARSKLEYTTLATAFCAPLFTITELRHVYETVWGQQLDPRNFHRKVTSVQDFLVPTGEHTVQHGGRPAMLYRRGSAALLHPAILRGENGARPKMLTNGIRAD